MKRIFLIILSLIAFQAYSQSVLTPELLWKLGRVSDLQVSPDKTMALYGVTWYDLESNTSKRFLYIAPIDGSKSPMRVTSSTASEYNGRFTPDGKRIGYMSTAGGNGMQLWEMNLDGSNPVQMGSIPGGINGFEYAPNGKHVAFVRDVKLDATPAETYPDLPKNTAIIAEDLMYRHWDSWHDYAYSHICIAPIDKDGMGRFKDIMEGERYDSPLTPWGGTEQIGWSPDGTKLAYTCRKKNGKAEAVSTDSEIFVYDLTTGTTDNMSEPGFEGYDQDPVFSPDGSILVWRSMEEEGFESDKDRIILFNYKTKSFTDLSKDFDQSSSHFTFSPDGKDLYFISGHHATYQIYKMRIDTRKITPITQGIHDYQSFALAGDKMVGQKMSMSMPSEIFVIGKDGKEKQLSFTNRDVLKDVTMAKVEGRWIGTSDGKQMLTWVLYPPNFDPDQKYPALLYCQGGPQSAVSQFFSYRWNLQIMAANGYIVVAPNRRGLPTFGQEWNDQISGDYGGQNMIDYLTAIDTLAAEPYVDKEHLGAVGASYGGYSVFWLAGNHNKRFKAFISHCGIFDFESMYGSTEEYWFVNKDYEGPYWQNPKPKSYEFSPHRFVQNWDTPILIVSGGNDFRIPYTQSIEAFNCAQLLGVPSKFLFFPDESHFVLKPQNSVLWQREFFGWLDKYLKE